VVVSPVGTDIGNGTALKNALAGITDASATKPYLLYIEPGTYDLGGPINNDPTLRMKPHVDVQGAGELQTVITGESSCTPFPTVYGANDTELRFLTVRSTGTDVCAAAIVNDHVTSTRLTHVTAESTGAGGKNHMGVNNESSTDVKMTDVTARASGGQSNTAVFNIRGTKTTMTDVTATASGSGANGQNIGVHNAVSNSTVTDVTATASGASNSNIGMSVGASDTTLTDVTATASGSGANIGMLVTAPDTTITGGTVTASGGTGTNGLFVVTAVNLTISDVMATASGSSNSNVGMNVSSTPDVTVKQSKLSGTEAGLNSQSDSNNIKVALSQIVGPIFPHGTLQCFNNYDENLDAVTCPQ
jgi:hypothetical protein